MLEDDRVDVVHLTTPNNLHHPQVVQALAAGKHVVCEKPLAMTAEESAELVELAASSGLVNCTNFNIRFYPLVQEARSGSARARSATSGTSTAATCRTGSRSRRTGTGAWSRSARGSCAPWATSARTGWT